MFHSESIINLTNHKINFFKKSKGRLPTKEEKNIVICALMNDNYVFNKQNEMIQTEANDLFDSNEQIDIYLKSLEIPLYIIEYSDYKIGISPYVRFEAKNEIVQNDVSYFTTDIFVITLDNERVYMPKDGYILSPNLPQSIKFIDDEDSHLWLMYEKTHEKSLDI